VGHWRATRDQWRVIAAVGIGGFGGGLARYGIDVAWTEPAGTFPWATFVINASGAFVLALVLVIGLELLPSRRLLRPALGTGFCGGYTTFSTLAVDTDRLAAHGHAGLAAVYVLTSVFVGLAATVVGIGIGRSVVAASAGRSS
jgi:CrcB protein